MLSMSISLTTAFEAVVRVLLRGGGPRRLIRSQRSRLLLDVPPAGAALSVPHVRVLPVPPHVLPAPPVVLPVPVLPLTVQHDEHRHKLLLFTCMHKHKHPNGIWMCKNNSLSFSTAANNEANSKNTNRNDRNDANATLSYLSTSYLVQHFQSLVDQGDATYDEFQIKALTQLDILRNYILRSRQYHTNQNFNMKNHNKDQEQVSSIGDFEEMEVTNNYDNSFMKKLTSLFTSSSSNFNDNHTIQRRKSEHTNFAKGVYLHGGVGCGKTFCMNLFYDSLVNNNSNNNNHTINNSTGVYTGPVISKQKVHFHSFMLNIHKQMHQAKMIHKIQGDVLPHIIQNTIRNGYIICFDEFQVTDVADALILRRLFTGLIQAGAIIVATSNRPPQDLYLNGIQRDLFLPFIDLLNDTLHVVSMWDSDVDYRLIQGENKARGVYFIESNDNNNNGKNEFEQAFQKLTKGSNDIEATTLTTQGRKISVPQASLQYCIARFTFDDLCRQARGAADYLLIGENFHTVFVQDVPILTMNDVNLVRRFIIFVDSMYECNVKLIIHAAAGPNDIFKVDLDNQFCDEAFAFDRTRSRLEEMGSDEYLKKRWIARK